MQEMQRDGPWVRRPEPDGAFGGGGLARPVRPEDAEDLALGHRERDVVHRDHGPVGLAEVLDLHRRPARGRCRLAGTCHRLNPHLILRSLIPPSPTGSAPPPVPGRRGITPTPPRAPPP